MRVRAEGRRRVYELDPTPLKSIDAWIDHYLAFWETALDDLAKEVERGRVERRERHGGSN